MAQNTRTTDAYIEKYKELEQCVRAPYGTVLDYEKTLPQEEASKLQICRIIRNHIQHSNEKSFVAVTDDMMVFLDKQIHKVLSKNGTLKDFMTSTAKYGFITADMSVFDAASLLMKKRRNRGLVLDKKGQIIGMFSKDLVSDLFGSNQLTKTTKVGKVADKLDTNCAIEYVTADTAMRRVDNMIERNPKLIVVATSSTGKFSGVYNA